MHVSDSHSVYHMALLGRAAYLATHISRPILCFYLFLIIWENNTIGNQIRGWQYAVTPPLSAVANQVCSAERDALVSPL